MDRISLALCCTKVPFSTIDGIVPQIGMEGVTLTFARTSDTSLRLAPWPFKIASISLHLLQRTLPARPFASIDEFRRAYAAATDVPHALSVHA